MSWKKNFPRKSWFSRARVIHKCVVILGKGKILPLPPNRSRVSSFQIGILLVALHTVTMSGPLKGRYVTMGSPYPVTWRTVNGPLTVTVGFSLIRSRLHFSHLICSFVALDASLTEIIGPNITIGSRSGLIQNLFALVWRDQHELGYLLYRGSLIISKWLESIQISLLAFINNICQP